MRGRRVGPGWKVCGAAPVMGPTGVEKEVNELVKVNDVSMVSTTFLRL